MLKYKSFVPALILIITAFYAVGVNPTWDKFMNPDFHKPGNNNTPENIQSISGHFDGETLDTIALFPYDGAPDDGEFYFDKWILISKNGTVPTHIIESYWPTLVPEGDLDGNGRDEFGVTLTGKHGTWVTYKVFTLYNQKVSEFLEVNWWEGNEEDHQNIVSKGSKKGEVKYTTYLWKDEVKTEPHHKYHKIPQIRFSISNAEMTEAKPANCMAVVI